MNIPAPAKGKKRVVIIGGGFGGLKLARDLDPKLFQTVLVDKNNYHQFQPLLYQVASSGLDASSICFPFRKVFHKKADFYFKLAEVGSVSADKNEIHTSIGTLSYDYLVIAIGTTTNYYGNDKMAELTLPMKSAEEALSLRNTILLNLEKASDNKDAALRSGLMNIAIVGGGATGVEIAGVLSEMKRYMIPKDYREISSSDLTIYLIEGSSRLLGALSEKSSREALRFLKGMGVTVMLDKKVVDYDGEEITFEGGDKITAKTLIWVSGVAVPKLQGIPDELIGRGGRIMTDAFNRMQGCENVFILGDASFQTEEAFPNGYPQVAPVAIQQGELLSKNLKALQTGKEMLPFRYKDKGSMATVGRNKAVADLHTVHLGGFPAWVVWLVIHLRSILGVRNKIMVLIDWIWSYFTHDQSLRLIYFVRKPKTFKRNGS